MKPEYTTDIVIVTYFRKDFTKMMLDQLKKATRCEYRLIIVDNGSTDGTREMLQGMVRPNDKLILLPDNRGLEQAKNIASEHIKSPRFVDSDNDILVPNYPKTEKCWLEAQHNLMDKFPFFAALALRPQELVGVGQIFRNNTAAVSNNVCGGSMRMMDTAAVKEVGGWRDEFTNRSEEWHICGKLKEAGYLVGYAKELFCYHLFGDDNRWGYGEGIDHAHGKDTVDITDARYDCDPETHEPKFRHNE